jgi:DNA-binding NarL/FixJ family response regulator
MDVSMPELGGTEATKQILQASPLQRVLVLSAHEEVAFARMLLGAGAAGYALKRSAADELVRAVRIVAAGNSYIAPTLAGALVLGVHAQHRSGGLLPVVLSRRETEVLQLFTRGHAAKEIAERLLISPRTLETYKSRAMSKLDLHSRAELIRYAVHSGWLHDV